jgi:ADP-ribose pyrophosphatase
MEEHALTSTHVYRGRRISVRIDEVERADGHRTTREVVEHPGAVAILAWDAGAGRVAMVRQWRHATNGALLEIPAGTLEPDEPPDATARRELAEEVGLTAATWEAGPAFFTAPGFCDERMHLFLATDLRELEDGAAADVDEQIERSWLSLEEALDACDDGRIQDAKSIAALGWLAHRLR